MAAACNSASCDDKECKPNVVLSNTCNSLKASLLFILYIPYSATTTCSSGPINVYRSKRAKAGASASVI